MDQHIWKDVTELHARLLDHRPILQGHINYFVKEFEEKRGEREKERLDKVCEEVTDVKDRMIPESQQAMECFLANLQAKLKVATEVCHKIEEKEDNVEIAYLNDQRERRREEWENFMKRQYEKCDKIDDDFNEQVNSITNHYKELEEKLRKVQTNTP